MFKRTQILAILVLINGYQSIGQIRLIQTIKGDITPKSVVHSGTGIFFAQNMIYSHSVTVYNRQYELVKTIKDRINLSDYDHDGGVVKGGPVEAAFSHNGTIAWVSNYTMEGPAFKKPGCDNCSGKNYDSGFLYKISTTTYEIEKVIQVGAVPKFVAATPNNKYVLVSNWTSGDVSIIDTNTDEVVRTIYIGRHPRGIVVDNQSRYAYITVMGSDKIAKLNLDTFEHTYLPPVGRAPRHVCIDNIDRYLYCSINNLGKVVKIDLKSELIVDEVTTGRAPRSMEISPDGKYLYVVNYNSNTFSKVSTSDMKELQEISTKSHPIGITLNWQNKEIWVACYSGYLQVFRDDSIRIEPEKEADLLAMTNASLVLIKNNLSPEQKAVSESEVASIQVESEIEAETVENNFLPNTYIIVGSFSVKSNASNYEQKLIKEGYDALTMPSMKDGFTYTAIRVTANPTTELVQAKDDIISSAWIYRP